MNHDEIIKEVRSVREAYGQKFGFDISAIFRDAQSREQERNRRTVALEPKPAQTVTVGPEDPK